MVRRIINVPRKATVERTIESRYDELMQLYKPHYIGVSKKYVRGDKQPQTAITFYVGRKGDDVEGESIPKTIDLVYADGSFRGEVLTDVVEVGELPIALAIRGGDVVRDAAGAPGTAGLTLRHQGRDLVLTNAHVVTNPGAMPGQVTVADSQGGGLFAGNVLRLDNLAAPVIGSDSALIHVATNAVAPRTIQNNGMPVIAFDEARINDPRAFLYVSGGLTYVMRYDAWIPAPTQIVVDGVIKLYAGFHQFRMMKGVAAPGHSGSLIYCQTNAGLVATALLFGGIPTKAIVLAFPIRRSLHQMGLPS